MNSALKMNLFNLAAEKRRGILALKEERLTEHPTAYYRAGFDVLVTTGLVQPTQDYVLLRAVTHVEIESAHESTLALVLGDRLKDAAHFEVVAVGPVVTMTQRKSWWRRLLGADHPVAILARNDAGVGMVRIHYPLGSLDHIQPGRACIGVHSAADALDASGDGMYQLVRACFIPVAWDQEAAPARVVASVQAMQAEWAETAARQQQEAEEHRRYLDAARAEVVRQREQDADTETDGGGEVVFGAPAVHIAKKHRSAG